LPRPAYFRPARSSAVSAQARLQANQPSTSSPASIEAEAASAKPDLNAAFTNDFVKQADDKHRRQ